MEKISDEKLELFAGMEPIDAVDKTVKSMASNLLQTRADLAAAREELALYRWIPASERLPEIGKPVLVLNSAGMSFVLLLTSENQWVDHEDTLYWHITHWMPLPLPPKEGE